MLRRLIAKLFHFEEKPPPPGYMRFDSLTEEQVEAAMAGKYRLIKFVESDDLPGRYYTVFHHRDDAMWTCTCGESNQPCVHVRGVQQGKW